MKEKPIIAEMEELSKTIPPEDWYDNPKVPQHIKDFQENIRTSSDDLWYCYNNGYIETDLITDNNNHDVERILEIVEKFGMEF